MNNTIHFLWIFGELSLLEKMCLYSFKKNGYVVELWTYNPDLIKKQLSNDSHLNTLIISDASHIISKNLIFSYSGNGDCRKGSYGGFSDIFRYELLYQLGGWYCDIDILCITKFIDFDDIEYVFRPHHFTEICGNIIKCPKKSELMNTCRNESIEFVTKDNSNWHLPLQILQKNYNKLDLNKFKCDINYFGNDDFQNMKIANNNFHEIFLEKDKIKKYSIRNNIDTMSTYDQKFGFYFPYKYAFHWMNEANSVSGFNLKKVNWDLPLPRTIYKESLRNVFN